MMGAQMDERYSRVGRLLEGVRLLPPDATDADARALGWQGLLRSEVWRETGAGALGARRWLGAYSEEMVAQFLARFGVLDKLARAVGLQSTDGLRLECAVGGEGARSGRPQTARVWWVGFDDAPLLTLSLRREYTLRAARDGSPLGMGWPTLYIDHFGVNDPIGRFDRVERWPLPGQQRPGLGLLEVLVPLLLRWSALTGAKALTQLPEYFHGAVVFSRVFTYVGPQMRGLLAGATAQLLGRPMPLAARLGGGAGRALVRRRRRLTRTSWAFEWGYVRTPDGHPLLWPTELQARALDGAFWQGAQAAIPAPRLRLAHKALRARFAGLLASVCAPT
jgi:hypothetical protein